MVYEPIGWKTGDIISAEKLNKMDNGWSVSSTQLFSETVTTADDGNGYSSVDLTYSQQITASTVIVTFDGTDYTCQAIYDGYVYWYGGVDDGPDFSEYPFALECGQSYVTLYTQVSGTHTVSAAIAAMEVSANFASAVSEVAQPLVATSASFPVVIGTTLFSEAFTALRNQGRLGYVVATTLYYDKPSSFEPILSITQSTLAIKTLGIINGELTIRTYTASSDSSPFVLNS